MLTNNKSRGLKGVPMDGISCLITVINVNKMLTHVYKQWITCLKEGTYGWDITFVKKSSKIPKG